MMSLYNTANWFHESPNVYGTHRTPGGIRGLVSLKFKLPYLSLISGMQYRAISGRVIMGRKYKHCREILPFR